MPSFRCLAALRALAAATLLGACADATSPDVRIAPRAPSAAASAIVIGGPPSDPLPDPCPQCTLPTGRLLFTQQLGAALPTLWSILADGTGLQKEGDEMEDPAWIGNSTTRFLYTRHESQAPQWSPWIQARYVASVFGVVSDQAMGDPGVDEPSSDPAGKRFVYVIHDIGDRAQLWLHVMDAFQVVKPTQLTGGTDTDRWPHWSPDGKTIVFASTRAGTGTPGAYHLWRIAPDGTGLMQLSALEARHPVYSPDGTRIAFTTATNAGDRVALMSAAGGNVTILPTNVAASRPTWSRDGKWLAYEAAVSPAGSIWLAHPDGSGAHVISLSGHAPRWAR